MDKVLLVSKPIDYHSVESINSNNLITWLNIDTRTNEKVDMFRWVSYAPLLSPFDSSVEVLRQGDGYCIITSDSIVRVEEVSGNSVLYIDGKGFVVTSHRIENLEDVLVNHRFIRIHANHLVNIKYLSNFVKCEAFVTLTNSEAIPVDTGHDRKIIEFLKSKAIH